jgi:hypothetical protein
MFRYASKPARLSILLVESTALVAGWAIWAPVGLEQLPLALVYVLAVWVAAGGIILGTYVAFSLAPFSDLVVEAWRVSANAMWLVPGALLLAARWPLAVAAGVVAVINATRLLVLSRAPKGDSIGGRRRGRKKSEPRLFGYQPVQPGLFSSEMLPIMAGALALQTGVYALAGGYPLLAAISLATVTAIWVGVSVARSALEPRVAGSVPYRAAGILVTLLWTTTLTLVLLHMEIQVESPVAKASTLDRGTPLETPGMTRRVLHRLKHGPPAASKVAAQATKAVVTQVVDPGPAIGAKAENGIPGVVLRPTPVKPQRPPMTVPGARLQLSLAQSLSIPFTGEYELFRTSSGNLPKGAIVEVGSPLERIYGTTNGGPMETVAVQMFEPPIDLTHCDKVLVTLTTVETLPILASMQLVAEESAEDGGTDMIGMKPAGAQTLEFWVPLTSKLLQVHAIRIRFQRPAFDTDKNVRVNVERFTLVPRSH